MKLSIAIPVYNEAKTIEAALARVRSATLPHGWTKEIIIVDDASTDGSRDILRSIPGDHVLIMRERNGGKGAALKDAFRSASGDYLIIQDADNEYDAHDFGALLEPILAEETHIVFGSRTMKANKVPLTRIYFYGGLMLTKVFNFLFKLKLTDLATCYKVFPRVYVDELASYTANDFVFDVVELSHFLQKKGKIVEIPISYNPRQIQDGKKINWKHGLKCFIRILTLSLRDRFVYVVEVLPQSVA